MKLFSPNLIIAILVIVLLVAAAFIFVNRQNNAAYPETVAMPSDSTLAANAERSDSLPASFNETYIGSSISGTPIPSQEPFSSYIYKGANIKNQTASHLELESSNDATAITEWYKKMIRDLNFNAKSFSQTNSNGVIFNKLSAARPAEKIEITIKKDQTASIVVITVDRF